MPRKKLSELTPIERADKILKDVSWEDAEKVGIEILARCMAKQVYVNNNKECLMRFAESICTRGDEWAKENATQLAITKVTIEHDKKPKP